MDFPTIAHTDAITSTITYEDGLEEKILTGRGWKKKFSNGILKEHTIYADKKNNRLPTQILRNPDGSDKTLILYNPDLQINQAISTTTDKSWTQPPGDPHAPFSPIDQDLTITKKNLRLTYQNDPALPGFHQVLRVRDYGLDQTFTYNTTNQLLDSLSEVF